MEKLAACLYPKMKQAIKVKKITKTAYLKESYDEAFQAEIEKIAISEGKITRAIGQRLLDHSGRGATKKMFGVGLPRNGISSAEVMEGMGSNILKYTPKLKSSATGSARNDLKKAVTATQKLTKTKEPFIKEKSLKKWIIDSGA